VPPVTDPATVPVAPLPAKPGEDQGPNYKTGDRRDLDRLIENAR